MTPSRKTFPSSKTSKNKIHLSSHQLSSRLKMIKLSDEKAKSSKNPDLEFTEQVKFLKSVLDKVKKEIMSDVYTAQKDIDTLKATKLSAIEYYEFKNNAQACINKCDTLDYLASSLKDLGNLFVFNNRR